MFATDFMLPFFFSSSPSIKFQTVNLGSLKNEKLSFVIGGQKSILN